MSADTGKENVWQWSMQRSAFFWHASVILRLEPGVRSCGYGLYGASCPMIGGVPLGIWAVGAFLGDSLRQKQPISTVSTISIAPI